MQIKENITATRNPKVANLHAPIKMVKLRSKDIVSKNSDKLMEPTWIVETETKEVQKEIVPSEVSQKEEVKENEVSVESTTALKEEINKTPVALPLTSEDVIRNKKDTLGIEAYKDIESNIVNLVNYQNARRLRVNEVVVGNANRERNINGIERVNQKIEASAPIEKTVNNAFDFSNLGNMNSVDNNSVDKSLNEKEEMPEYNNNTKLDEWLNKETSPNKSGNDKVLDEVNELQAKLNDNASSLATQKEILEALRARIANNEALVQAKKQELEEENMNVTRELNDVLAEITQLTNLASEQEAFLGISNDDDSYGKGRM